jgi:heat shock protein HslJ
MYYVRSSFVALTLVGALSTACTESTFSPAAPTGSSGNATDLTAGQAPATGQITGTWTLVSLQNAGGPVEATPNATYTLTVDGNRASARADCNQCGGSFTASGDKVTIGPALACTRAACATMAFESAFESLLSGESTVVRDGNTLTLVSSRGRLVFRQ